MKLVGGVFDGVELPSLELLPPLRIVVYAVDVYGNSIDTGEVHEYAPNILRDSRTKNGERVEWHPVTVGRQEGL